MKHIRIVILSLIGLIYSYQGYSYDFKVDGIYYNIIAGTLDEVETTNKDVLYRGTEYTGEIFIPKTVFYNNKEYKVKRIGYRTFMNNQYITFVSIPNSIESIGEEAFRDCTHLTSITLPKSIKTIGNGAFGFSSSGLNHLVIVKLKMTEVFAYGEANFDKPPYSESTLYVPYGKMSLYRSFERYFTNVVESPEEFDLEITSEGNGYVAYGQMNLRNHTHTYEVEKGRSTTILFSPDNRHQIKRLTLNDRDVTNDVQNNSYNVKDMASDMTIKVEFEAIPPTQYKLHIKATGNGSVTYNGTAFRSKTQSFTVNEGTSATVTFTPDAGYKIKNVKLNGTDITSSVSNNQYTISNINSDTTLEVVFEAITHTLSITASGNGSATYNSTTVRGKTQAFTVNEGTSATIAFVPDAGYKISNVKVNNTDVTANVVSNKYTISNITANTTLSVAFEAITHTMSITASGNGSVTYNSTAVRGKTQTFNINEGTSAVVKFTPDTGYKLKSVKLNGTDVTSSVSNNQYTISNISSDTNLEVVFEGITHTLSITASGNGSATYNSTVVRGKTQAFTVNEGSSATITFTPDDGFRISSVKVNNTDVTTSVVNDQYTISNITTNTTLIVTFEAIPTYTLAIQSTAFGSVKYGDAVITNQTETFTVREGSQAVLTFAADGNGRLIRITLNGEDITPSLTNGQYTISDIRTDQTVVAEYAEDITKLLEGGVAYSVTSYDEGSVVVAPGNYGQVLTVPASFEAKGRTWTVTGIADDALVGNSTLASVIWEPEVRFTAEVTNPNLLLYVARAEYAPEAIQNVVVGDMAESIVLTDADAGNDFYCPQAFTARRITYEHNYGMTTGYHETQGWETIVLPFDVTTVLNRRGTELVAYATWQHGSNQRPYWLYQLTGQGWKTADGIKANTPYIISMPNNPVYEPSYNQTGYIQFVGNNAIVAATDQMVTSQNGSKQLLANYQTQAANSNIYALNVSNQWSMNTDTAKEGSTFIRNLRTIHPFEAYLTLEGNNTPRAIGIFDGATGVNEELRMKNEEFATAAEWYDLQGRRLNGEPTKKGVYISNGKKVKR